MNFLLVPMCSLWTQLENSRGPSVPLVAMLLVPNVESKADLLSHEGILTYLFSSEFSLSYKSLPLLEAAPA